MQFCGEVFLESLGECDFEGGIFGIELFEVNWVENEQVVRCQCQCIDGVCVVVDEVYFFEELILCEVGDFEVVVGGLMLKVYFV